jgi:23S rRNA (cytidine1920-2'-O)/16S rRNA (cytidine1409-2'-O)-methyltransferase
MKRADQILVEKGHAESRSEAQSAIRAGLVKVDGELVDKPSRGIAEGAVIQYAKPHPYVSRGGIKLAAALDHFDLSPEGRVCLDLGASTGGFSEVLLAGGARRVYAVDVGHGQMHPRLRRDARIVLRDGVNARDLSALHVPERPEAVVADVSFIGLKLALPPALDMAISGAWLVALVKPQFEVGRIKLGKGGIVKDIEAQLAALAEIKHFISGQSRWAVLGHIESPILGGEGNKEFLIAAQKA